MPRIPEYPEQVLESVFIPLTQGRFAVVDVADLDLVRPYSWSSSNGYAAHKTEKDKVYMHRLIMGLGKGDKRYVDHINGDTGDNRRSNLRIVTMSENLRNMRRQAPHSSRFKGVTWDARRETWAAQATLNYRHHFLGYHDTEELAAQAYDAFARQHFGAHARTNFA